MTRTRPTMADYYAARNLELYEQHTDRLEHLGNGRWCVFATADVYDHRVDSEHGSLGGALARVRELVGDGDG